MDLYDLSKNLNKYNIQNRIVEVTSKYTWRMNRNIISIISNKMKLDHSNVKKAIRLTPTALQDLDLPYDEDNNDIVGIAMFIAIYMAIDDDRIPNTALLLKQVKYAYSFVEKLVSINSFDYIEDNISHIQKQCETTYFDNVK